jgi:deoxyhypusine synthase
MPHDPHAAAPRPEQQLADGWSDQLKPLAPLDVMSAGSMSEMLRQMSVTSFGGRNLGEAADVLHQMVSDPRCLIVGTFSGAMTIAKMGLLLTEMIDQGMLHAVVSTGALMCHGLVEQTGHTHFRYDPSWGDDRLYEAGYARVYDTLELESNLDNAERIIRPVLGELSTLPAFGSHEFNAAVGRYLAEHFEGRGILQSAQKKGVPVYVPAFTDSELGIDVYTYNVMAAQRNVAPVRFDALRDMQDYYERCMKAERLGIFTIGGGTPRNWAQQVGPLAELMHRRSGGTFGGLIRFQYGVRICPEPDHWGGLSGCTYSEGVSWGKFVPPAEGGRYAEVHCDATIGWPILVRGVLERMRRV